MSFMHYGILGPRLKAIFSLHHWLERTLAIREFFPGLRHVEATELFISLNP
ncbi:hypothetical protein PSEUDO8O_170233 [Pseudomonas sp. 8O]|nr:hypothetical protein PSEUDO8O_170233 [Pseudomonas sp. 8O]